MGSLTKTLSNISARDHSLRSRRLEVVGEREHGRARGRHAKGESPSSAPVFSCADDFQAPATQATPISVTSEEMVLLEEVSERFIGSSVILVYKEK